MNLVDRLPASLHPWIEGFAVLAKPCVRIEIVDEVVDTPFVSCIGDTPFWPINKKWPLDDKGRPLFGLLQINLKDFPVLPMWPAEGILQIFIADTIFWGADPDDAANQSCFRVVFHEAALIKENKLLTDRSFLPNFEELPWQKKKPKKLIGKIDEMLMPYGDNHFPEELTAAFDSFGDEKWEIINAYQKAIGVNGHRLGGYPFFLQDDPRPENSIAQALLLQLDSDPQAGLMWGDFGMAHWFTETVTAERSLDEPTLAAAFEKVTYVWESN